MRMDKPMTSSLYCLVRNTLGATYVTMTNKFLTPMKIMCRKYSIYPFAHVYPPN